MTERKITRNAFFCKKCKQTPESTHRHHLAMCACGNFTDGGTEYVRQGGNFQDMEDRCTYGPQES